MVAVEVVAVWGVWVVVVSGALPSDFPPIYFTSMTSSNLVGCKPGHRHCRLLRRRRERPSRRTAE
jgi:hypothetical protein